MMKIIYGIHISYVYRIYLIHVLYLLCCILNIQKVVEMFTLCVIYAFNITGMLGIK